MERLKPWLLAGAGVAMTVVAAFDYLAAPVATAFAILGAALICFGAIFDRLEGAIEVGMSGLKGTFKTRAERTVKAADETSPFTSAIVREALGTVSPSSSYAVWVEPEIDDADRAAELADFKRRLMFPR